MSIEKEMEALKTHPLEYSRQTGRTTRMMEQAKEVAAQGKPVVVVFRDEHIVKHWREKYPNIKGMSMIPMKLHMPEMDWTRLKIVDGPYAYHETFIDHDVIYVYHKELFKAYHQYDRPMDRQPYLEPKQAAA